MPTTKIMKAMRTGQKGNFAACRNRLLSHFNDPGARGERSWRQSFGYERTPEKPKGGEPFIAREARRSSSDS